MKAAQDWAKAQNPPKSTVELTAGGHILDGLGLFADNNGITCKGACRNEDRAQAGYYWNCASMWFAQQASGEIHAFGSKANMKSPFNNGVPTFWNIELPNLLANNPNVKIIYNCYQANYVWYPVPGQAGCKDYSTLTATQKAKLPVRGRLVYQKYYFEGERYPNYCNTDCAPGFCDTSAGDCVCPFGERVFVDGGCGGGSSGGMNTANLLAYLTAFLSPNISLLTFFPAMHLTCLLQELVDLKLLFPYCLSEKEKS